MVPEHSEDVNTGAAAPIRFTVITSHSCELAKRFDRDDRGELRSDAIAHMTSGLARTVTLEDVSQLGAVLSRLDAHQAITCGIPAAGGGGVPLTTRAGTAFNPGAVARTNEAFQYPHGPALFPIDVDVAEGSGAFASVGAVLDALEAASPWLKYAQRVALPSSSSYVGGRGLRGVHVYIALTHGTDSAALAERMQVEQWQRGHGNVKISKSGALLVRQLSDSLVYQPSRLMFEAAPVVADGIERTIPDGQAFIQRVPQVVGRPSGACVEGRLHVPALPELREIERRRFETQTRNAREARARDARRVAIDYQIARAVAQGFDVKEGERLGLMAARALNDRALPAAWSLALGRDVRVTVADVLADLGQFVGKFCADPFDTWREDLQPTHFAKAEIVTMGDRAGVWSHKLQAFFQFTDDRSVDLESPLGVAAEKLQGRIEYPERVARGKASPQVNIVHALRALLSETGALPRVNVCTGATECPTERPGDAELLAALTRVGCAGVQRRSIEETWDILARERSYDPWREAVLALPAWDGEARIDDFFPRVAGSDASDALRLTTQLLFASIVMRQLRPGTDCHVVPVLVGAGETGKSYFVGRLAAALGAPAPAALAFGESVRMSMSAATSVVAELCEMTGHGKREQEEIKLWIADGVDTYRAPYGREALAHPRRFVLVGTSNKDEVNTDETGNRRFMPVFVRRRIDDEWHRDCAQLLAEAKARFCEVDTYAALHRAATRAVGGYNAERMRNGEGMPLSDVEAVCVPLIRQMARTNPARRVYPGELFAKLSGRPEGRAVKSTRAIATWMRARQWPEGKTDGLYFTVPEDFLAPGDTDAGVPGGFMHAGTTAQQPSPAPMH